MIQCSFSFVIDFLVYVFNIIENFCPSCAVFRGGDKVGIKAGQMNFTFNADSTFTSTVGKKTLKGTYSYDASAKQVDLKFLKLLNLHAKVNCSSSSLELLFNSDKLLKLLAFIGSKSNSTALKTVSSLADNYDGMMLGFELSK